ncbi:MAG: superoxide dismutase [Anaerolineae bacterium]|nr:superoxide dismutase [Anaerolineae bacterium]
MKILALEHDVPGINAAEGRSQETAPLLRAEAGRVWELQQAGILRELYFRQNENAAVLVLECAGADEAQRVLETLPLVRAGLIAFEIIPLRPYPGFARLFDSEVKR